MQRIERYGVIALVVLLVTILAVSLWGERDGWDGWKFWKKDSKAGAGVEAKAPRRGGASALDGRTLPMNPTLPSAVDVEPTAGPGSALLAADSQRAHPPVAGGDPLAPFPSPLSPDLGGSRSAELSMLPERAADAPILGQRQGQGALDPQPLSAATAKPELKPAPALGGSPSVPSATRKYVVKNGDTLGEIASRELGSATLWPEIQQLNAAIDLRPTRLRPGMEILLPAGRSAAAPAPGKRSTSGSTAKAKPPAAKPSAGSYVVQRGDSLTRIAANELGSAKRWTEIRDLNPGIDPNRLVVGAKLVLPGGASTTVASAPSKERIGWGPSTAGKKSRVQ